MKIKKIALKAISIITCLAISVMNLSGCNESDDIDSSVIIDESSVISSNVDDPPDSLADVESGEIDDIYSLVCSSVKYALCDDGFNAESGIAYTTENDNYNALGIYYYNDSIKAEEFRPVGFVEICKESQESFNPEDEETLIVVDNTEQTDDDTEMICTYNYYNIRSSHFIYKNRYVTFQQESPMRVVYSEMDNNPKYYDLELGSLYDYDQKKYIYDEDIFSGNYQTHSSFGFFTEEERIEIAKSIETLSKEQEENGYYIEKVEIVYISPENIQAYLESNENDSFFGYDVSELKSSFGEGKTIEYKDGKFVEVNHWYDNLKDYNWKSFLTKIGIGAGIIIVSAILSPITGGSSFGCALVTIAKKAVGSSLFMGLTTLVKETVNNIKNGDSFVDALLHSTGKGLDSFADTFVITSALFGIGHNVKNLISKKAIENGKTMEVSSAKNASRQKAVEDAWKKEQQRVIDGTSKYNWTKKQMTELKTVGKVSGYEGHHIITVEQLKKLKLDNLISSADDIVFLTREQHLMVHAGNWKNPTDTKVLIELLPWASKQITNLTKIAKVAA